MNYPDIKVQGANMEPFLGRQDPGEPHVGHMNLAISVLIHIQTYTLTSTPVSLNTH